MAGALLRVQIVNGRIGHDPDRFDPIGEHPYIRVSVAVNKTVKDDTGEWVEKVDWWKVRFYDRLGDLVSKHLKKGDLVFIEGTFMRVKNETGSDVEIRARDVQFSGKCSVCGGRK